MWQRGACVAKGEGMPKRVHGEGGLVAKGGMHGKGGGACMAKGGHAWQIGACVAGETASAADGMHPTGMHSCCTSFLTNRL